MSLARLPVCREGQAPDDRPTAAAAAAAAIAAIWSRIRTCEIDLEIYELALLFTI